MKKTSFVIIILVLALVLAACTAAPGTSIPPSASPNVGGSTPAVSDEPPGKLSIWMNIINEASNLVSSNSELPFYIELQKKLNVEIEFQHPPVGMANDQFKLLIASKALPDIIEHNWFTQYPNGPEAALADGVIMNLNSVIANDAPNLRRLLESDSLLDKLVKTNDGDYYIFPQVRDTDLMHQKAWGLMLRRDMLDQVNMDMPTCIPEWYAVLTAFKDQLGLAYPYSSTYGRMRDESAFLGAYGISGGFYHENGTIMFGMIQPQYKDYLAEMRKWYAEGLLDPDLFTIDQNGVDGKITTDQAGATYSSADGGIGVYMQMMTKENPNMVMEGAPYPTLEKNGKRLYGGIPTSRYTTADSAAITTSCRDLATAVRFLDYGYSEEGYMYYNYGIEGVSYTMVDGKPKFSEDITANKDGLTFKQALSRYSRADVGGPFVKSLWPVLLQRAFPQQNEAADLYWSSVDWDTALPVISFSRSESEIITDVMSEVSGLWEEMTIKIIVGEKPLDSFESYVDSMNKAGIDKAIECYQTAYDRFQQR